jgi:hypothetical protein
LIRFAKIAGKRSDVWRKVFDRATETDDFCSLFKKGFGDGLSNPGGGSCDEDLFVSKHGGLLEREGLGSQSK